MESELGRSFKVVAVLLHDKWWPVCEVLKTSNKSRHGLVLVESLMERVVLFLLSQVVFGIQERSVGEDLYFSSYSLREHGKILWHDGEAVGFYTVKKRGSLCDGCSGQTYQLPVLDTLFVRCNWRRFGFAFQMLEDFCSSQTSEIFLGISFPMSLGMYRVCKKYLENHKEDRERLYEVEAPGEWAQRRNVWLNIQLNYLCVNSEQGPESSCRQERSETDLEVGFKEQWGSSSKDKPSSGKKRPKNGYQHKRRTVMKKNLRRIQSSPQKP
ncbi:hypothetical protein DNTS_003348 [Danionella cerebrum]|uniref:Family with sequence similarity 169 member B n=1 Tax=Danionella cerebrum TaxID=2873325 RepID=A0A553NLU5_9TELE|nr:hypothetical protein DNTS_003348 [Danionella translucida]